MIGPIIGCLLIVVGLLGLWLDVKARERRK